MRSSILQFDSDHTRSSSNPTGINLKVLWDFSRPHTIIGSTISILVLFLLANEPFEFQVNAQLFFWTWISALGCNVFITGLNQIYDIEIDKINKPFLPLADGRLLVREAWYIVIIALIICFGVAAFLSIWLLLLMIAIAVIGALYSLPQVRFKKHHLPAALSIVVVRGLLVNLGIGYWFEYIIHQSIQQHSLIIPLTIVITAFSFVIAWFKDLNDIEGDQQHEVKTLAILYNEKFAIYAGSFLVISSLLVSTFLVHRLLFLGISQIVLILAYGLHYKLSDLSSTQGMYQFYLKFWIFFVVAYLLFGIQTFIN